jgi:hypothetical protein
MAFVDLKAISHFKTHSLGHLINVLIWGVFIDVIDALETQNLAGWVVCVHIIGGKVFVDFIVIYGLLLQYSSWLWKFRPSAPANLFHHLTAFYLLVDPLIFLSLYLWNLLFAQVLVGKAFKSVAKTSSHSISDFALQFFVGVLRVFIAGLWDICRIVYRGTAVIKPESLFELFREFALVLFAELIRSKASILAVFRPLELPHQLRDITWSIGNVGVLCNALISIRLLSDQEFLCVWFWKIVLLPFSHLRHFHIAGNIANIYRFLDLGCARI